MVFYRYTSPLNTLNFYCLKDRRQVKSNRTENTDQNFDNIAEKFSNRIYATGKGKIRQAILSRDLQPFIDSETPLKILDVGGGQGHMAEHFVKAGHEVVLNDISTVMLASAKQRWAEQGLDDSRVTYIDMPLQELAEQVKTGEFDLVMCHAVFEWLKDARAAFELLTKWVSPNGMISLMFFNKDALRFGNILYGNFDYVNNGLTVKKKVAMNPNYPLPLATVWQWIDELHLTIHKHSGVRCFHDYVKRESQAQWLEDLIQMELQYAHLDPYRALGKYQHLLLSTQPQPEG